MDVMKIVPFILVFVAVFLAGCRSNKTATIEESSVMNDTIAAIITEYTDENTEKSKFSTFSSDSIGIHFSADSVRVGDMVIYGPEISTEAKGLGLSQESDQKKTSTGNVGIDIFSSSGSATNKAEDIAKETSLGPTAGDAFLIVGLLIAFFIVCVVIPKYPPNRNN